MASRRKRRQPLRSVNPREHPLELFKSATEQDDVVTSEEQRGHLGEFLDGWSVVVWHDLPQSVQRSVDVMHALSLPHVHPQPELLLCVRSHAFGRDPAVRRALSMSLPRTALGFQVHLVSCFDVEFFGVDVDLEWSGEVLHSCSSCFHDFDEESSDDTLGW